MAVASLLLQTVFILITILLTLQYMGKGPFILRKLSETIHGKPGCLPLADVGNVTIHYFSGRGRADVIRLFLEEAEIPYTETKFTKDTWPTYKKKGTASGLYTFGQVPAIVTTAGLQLTQTQAILHHLGRSSGLDCDCEDYTFCEQVALGVEDARIKLTRMLYDPTYTVADRDYYLKEVMPVWLGYFERLAPSLIYQDKAFFASSRLTWVDFLVFHLVDINVDFGHYDFGNKSLHVEVIKQFPKLNNFYRLFVGRPRIAKYLQSQRRPAYSLPNLPAEMASQAK